MYSLLFTKFINFGNVFMFWKVITSIILTLAVCIPTFHSVYTLISFEVNRGYIIRELCINRYRPELKCHGKCILMTKLRVTMEERQDNNKNLLHHQLIAIKEWKPFYTEKTNNISLYNDGSHSIFYYANFLYSTLVRIGVFRPPLI